MTPQQELDSSIKELRRLTGLDLQIKVQDEADIDATISKVNSLNQAYKEKNNKDIVLKRWLTGEISYDEFYPVATKLHLTLEERRVVFLVSLSSEIDDSVLEVLRHAFPDRSHVWLIPQNKSHLIIVYRFSKMSMDQVKSTAYQINDILNSELYMTAFTSYSDMKTHLEQLSTAYQEAYLAMEVGKTFYSDQIIYAHNSLGIGRLLYGLPADTCKAYITECLGNTFDSADSPIFQDEIRHTVNCFLKNNLNIAETARQLHMHRNTLLYRLEQIQNESGLDIRKFNDAMKYRICSMLLPYSEE